MTTIDIKIVKELRDRTGVSIMQCKKAIEKTNGNLGEAEILLQKLSSAIAQKKSSRTLGAGTVASYIHDSTIGALVLLSCETDFVGRNESFVSLARDIAMQVAATNPTYRSLKEVSEEAQNTARTVFEKEVVDKPENMREKILAGKMESYFKDKTLLDQSYIKDESKTVRSLIEEAIQKFGERIEVSEFTRFSAR